MITLPTGRQIPLDYISFDPASNRFFYGGLDVTPYMTRAQMVEVGGAAFDVEAANRAASDAARIARGEQPYADGGETSVAKLWLDGVGSDVAKLARDTRDFFGIGEENAGKGSPIIRLVIVAGVVFALHQLGVFAWIKKKLTA